MGQPDAHHDSYAKEWALSDLYCACSDRQAADGSERGSEEASQRVVDPTHTCVIPH